MRRSSPTVLATSLAVFLGLGAATGCFTDTGRTSASEGSEGDSEASEPTPGSSTGAPTSGEPTTGDLTTGEASTAGSTGEQPGICGNYQLDPGEECDNGETNNGQGGSICKANCTKNVCGDGYIAANEDCDDGNQISDDVCSNVCTLNDCGDGSVGPGEQCDDGNQVGVAIAQNWEDLLTGSLLVPININEIQQVVLGGLPDCNNADKLVWTNTAAAGLLDTEANCTDWSSDQLTTKAGLGNLLQINSGWTESCEVACAAMARLYCFEQP